MDRRAKLDRARWQQKMSINTLMLTGFLWTESIRWHFLCLFLVLIWMFCLFLPEKRCIIQVFFPLCYFAAKQVGFESRSLLCSLRWWFGVVVGAPRGDGHSLLHDATVKANSQAWFYTVCAPPTPPTRPAASWALFSQMLLQSFVCLKTPEAPNTWCSLPVSASLAKLAVSVSFCRIRRLVVHEEFRKMLCL